MVELNELENKTIYIPFGGYYLKVFTDTVTVITGCGRSGTSILGKIVGAMDNVEYLFEPSSPKFLMAQPALCRAVIFEDFVLPALQGRNINLDPGTESYSGYYINDEQLKHKWDNKRRIDLLPKIIGDTAPQFVLKLTELQGLTEIYEDIFPGVKFIHIIRNGMDVIQSMMKPNWYIDEYMETNSVDFVEIYHGLKDGKNKHFNVPWFIGHEMPLRQWVEYNHVTRCAAVWRITTQRMLEDVEGKVKVIKYKTLCDQPRKIMDELEDFLSKNRALPAKRNAITDRHIKSIMGHKSTKYLNMINDIQQPEREKFQALMTELGYSTD